jgi:hypothetical protein
MYFAPPELNLIQMPAAERQGGWDYDFPPLPTERAIQATCNEHIRVRSNDPVCCTGWPGVPVVSFEVTDDAFPVSSISTECVVQVCMNATINNHDCADLISLQDQGWGNTGHSRVSLVLESSAREMKSRVLIFIAFHEPIQGIITCDTITGHVEFLSSICIGDRISMYAESAPYPGYECKISPNAKMTITTSPSPWDRRKYAVLFLYYAGFQHLGSNMMRDMPSKKEVDEELRFPTTARVLNNMDICREIIYFL